jgi:hypothetical protein
MDLQNFVRVCWRFRGIVAVGLVLAITAALLSFVKPSFAQGKPTFAYRQQEQWISYSTLLVTQRGFPIGRSDADNPIQTVPSTNGTATVAPGGTTPYFAPSTRLADLATLYAQLVKSDVVLNLMRRQGPVHGEIRAVPVLSLETQGDPLPLVQVAALASTPDMATSLAHRDTQAFQVYLDRMQQQNGVPANRRVLVQVVDAPTKPLIWQGRKLTRPILTFLTLMIAVVGLVFILENMRPRIRKIEGPAIDQATSDAA